MLAAESLHIFARAALKLALEEARKFVGSTSPNPPVGAAALDENGQILSIRAHEKAGSPHAEALVLHDCEKQHLLHQLHSLVITLEPCNHFGKTPPCTEHIIQVAKKSPLNTIYFGTTDPNTQASQLSTEHLRSAGLEVINLESEECKQLIAPFAHWTSTKKPWITLKTAYDQNGSMIPPPGQKTFSSPEALRYAHLLRKSSDAILTGSGTVLADLPLFTVRHVPDHPDKTRWLALLDRRHRLQHQSLQNWMQERAADGFKVIITQDLEETIDFLGKQGVVELLIEAGPTLTQTVLSQDLWNRHVIITPNGIETKLKEMACSLA